MKVLVFSDSHGVTGAMMAACVREKMDVVIHLGDHASDLQEIHYAFPSIPSFAVRGNNDWDEVPQELKCILEGVSIYATHGHLQSVRHGTKTLVAQANKNECVLALYGHTHKGEIHQENGVLVMNPGSLSLPRDHSGGSYGVVMLEQNTVSAHIQTLDQLK